MTVHLTSAPEPEPRRPVVLPDPAFPVPPGELIPLTQDQVPDFMYLDDARRYAFPDRKEVIPGFVYAGAVVLAGRPGVGKTVLAMQWAMCVAMGVEWAGYVPEELGRVLVLDYENGIEHAAKTSRRLAEWLKVATDSTGGGRMMPWDAAPPGTTFPQRLAYLRTQLEEARDAGEPFAMWVIDSMTTFFSPYPRQVPRDQHEGACMRHLDRLALEFGCGGVTLAHTNKGGEVAGSTQIIGGLTAAWQINREPDNQDATLECIKNRAAPERNYKMTFPEGVYRLECRITPAQASNAGTKRLILDWLAEHGPATLADLRAGLPAVKSKTISDLLTRLHKKHFVTKTGDGEWALAGAGQVAPPAVETGSGWGPGTIGEAAQQCEVCGEPMTLIEPGQLAHPGCDPDGKLIRHPAARTAPPGEPAPPAETAAAGDADEEQGAEDQGDAEVKLCRDCGEELTDADPHPYCVPQDSVPKWPDAFDLLRKATTATGEGGTSHMTPVRWIPPAGHAKAEGKQNRDDPQWKAAVKAHESARSGFGWQRPRLLEEFGPDRLVVPFDRVQFFPSSCNSVPLAPNLLFPYGPLEVNPHLLGKTDPKTGRPIGLAGVALVVAPEYDDRHSPHPMGRLAVPGQPMWIVTGLLEDMWKQHARGILPAPEVLDSNLGRRVVGLLDPFAKGVKEARAQHEDDPEMTAAIKLYSSIALRLLYPKVAKSAYWRPDWHAAIVSQGGYRLWIRGRQAVEAGEIMTAMERTDAISFLLPEGADPDTWVPHGFTLGSSPGMIHHGDIHVRDNIDLSGIDPARITPSGHKRFVNITGPVPLRVWLNRRGGNRA